MKKVFYVMSVLALTSVLGACGCLNTSCGIGSSCGEGCGSNYTSGCCGSESYSVSNTCCGF